MMRKLWMLMLLLLASCFNPDPDKTRYRCVEAGPATLCPDGTVCTEGWCVRPGQQPPSDAGMGDMSPPVVTDLATPSRCTDGKGYRLGSAWACPGKFSLTNSPHKLCASGSAVCVTTTAGGIGADELRACRSLPGMYLSATIGTYNMDYNFATCDYVQPRHLLYGCGRVSGSQDVRNPCGGWLQGVDCINNPTLMVCPSGRFSAIDGVTNPVDTDGVLCCAQ